LVDSVEKVGIDQSRLPIPSEAADLRAATRNMEWFRSGISSDFKASRAISWPEIAAGLFQKTGR